MRIELACSVGLLEPDRVRGPGIRARRAEDSKVPDSIATQIHPDPGSNPSLRTSHHFGHGSRRDALGG